jgi:hypothetical protein
MPEESDAYQGTIEAPANGMPPVPTFPDLSDPAAFVTELSAVTPYFEAQAMVRVRIGPRVIALKIRSVPKEQLEAAMLQMRPKLPKYRDKQTGLLVVDEDSAPYRQWLQTYAYLKVILGLVAITLKDREGHIVWQSAEDRSAPVIQQMPAAVQALKDMAITMLQVEAISRAIDALSQVEQEQEIEELLGN